MKIQAINNNLNQNFKGLWGGVYTLSNATDSFSYHYETHYYYPFADEKDAEIEAAKNRYNSSFSVPWYQGAGIGLETREDVYVEPRLTFTEKQYNEYKAANNKPVEKWSESIKAVSIALSTLGLTSFLNKADAIKYEYEHAGYLKKLMMKLFRK